MYKLIPLLLLGQFALVLWLPHAQVWPATPDLTALRTPEDWRALPDEPVPSGLVETLHFDTQLSRSYRHEGDAAVAALFVAWFRSQQGGERQPHSPQVCLPASGWVQQEATPITLNTTAGPLHVKRLLVRNRQSRAQVLYWYQTPRRTTGNEWSAKFWVGVDALQEHRTDTALVRIIMWENSLPAKPSVETTIQEFAQVLFPELCRVLPR